MKIYKKHILLGIICSVAVLLQCVILQNTAIIAGFIPCLAFSICSLTANPKSKNAVGIISVLSAGFILLPVLAFVSSIIANLLPVSLISDILLLLVKYCTYFALFIFVNSLICKERFSFSPATGILTAVCITVYFVAEILQILTMISLLNQAIEVGYLYHWVSAAHGSPELNIISKVAFYTALWGTSVGFIKQRQVHLATE